MYFPLFVGVLCLSLFFYALLCVLSSFAIVFKRKKREREAGCFAFIVLGMYCYCKCSVTIPFGAVGWSVAGSVVCDCDIC